MQQLQEQQCFLCFSPGIQTHVSANKISRLNECDLSEQPTCWPLTMWALLQSHRHHADIQVQICAGQAAHICENGSTSCSGEASLLFCFKTKVIFVFTITATCTRYPWIWYETDSAMIKKKEDIIVMEMFFNVRCSTALLMFQIEDQITSWCARATHTKMANMELLRLA